MAKIKGITIELGADASGLEKALNDTNKALSETQKQLTSVNKSLKLDPKNLELVEQKQRLLTKATDETTKKLEALKAAQEKVSQSMGKDSKAQEQYDALSREISDTEVKLKKLNKEQQEFSKQAAQAQYDASAFGSALNAVGEKAQVVAEKTKALSAAAAGALAGIVTLTVTAAKQADEWDTMSQQIGLSTEAIQKFQYASERVDVDFSTITGAITRMKANLDSTSGVWEKIGVQVKDQHGQYRDIEAIFFDTIKALSRIENETERDTVAMDIFGKKANELAGIIDDGGAALKELGQEAESLGLIVSDEDIDRMTEYDDLLEGMKAQIKAALVSVAIPAIEALTPIVLKLSEAIKAIAQRLANMNPVVMIIIMMVLALVAAISPVATLIAKITIAVRGLAAAIPLISTALQTVQASATALMSNPYVLMIGLIIAALVLLGIAIYEVVQHWDEIKPAIDNAMNSMRSAIESGVSAVQGFADRIKQRFDDVMNAIQKVKDGFVSLGKKVKDVVMQVANAFSDLQQKARDAGANVINSFVSGVKAVISKVTQAFKQLADSIKSIWTKTAADATNAGRTTAQNYVNAYNQTQSSSRLLTRNPSSNLYNSGGYSANTFGSGDTLVLANSINSLSNSVNRMNAAQTTVNVELSGSAKNIFDTVRVQNNQLATATGYHALA